MMIRCSAHSPRRAISPRGFTLIELLVVISIIALLISILLPALGKARQSANMVKCQANMRSVAQVSHIYAYDFKGYFPASYDGSTSAYLPTWPRNVLVPYINKNQLSGPEGNPLICPTYQNASITGKTAPVLITYTYNRHYGDLAFPNNNDYIFRPFEQLKHGGGNLGGPSKKAFLVDGLSSTTARDTVEPYEIYIRVPYGANSNAKGLMNLHPGQTDNWAFFDGHVENKRVNYVAFVIDAIDIWYLYW
jgi:prepilin-type N-terminal cleavage/methylation domain-containing protein/prepilin-type processing-associated H-X9-DG protein